jgi:hypothetical protein
MIAIFRRKTWRERGHLGDLGVDGTCNSKVCIIQLSQINQEMYENVLVRPPGPDDKIDIQRVSFSFTLSIADACHGIRHRKQAFYATKKNPCCISQVCAAVTLFNSIKEVLGPTPSPQTQLLRYYS